MSDGFGIRNLTVNLGTADRPAAHICLLGTQICIGPTLCFQLTVPHSPACCHFVLTNCRHCVTHFATHGCWYLQSCPFASCPHLSVLPCGPISPFEGCGFGSPVINDPRGQVVNPAVDFASLKAQLRAAMAQLEEQEKLQVQALAPKSAEEVEDALRQLDTAQKQIESARTELQGKRSQGGKK